jgi:ArsR family transcriptional regulator
MIDGEKQPLYDEPRPVDLEAVLKDADSYLDFLRVRFGTKHVDDELEAWAYSYVLDPPAMQEFIVSQLRKMWNEHLAAEWERVEPMLRDAVQALRQIDFSAMSRLEAAQSIVGRELEEEKWEEALKRAEQVIFVPTAHIGPYLGRLGIGGDTLWVFFRARPPRGIQSQVPDLSLEEIVVRLSALADDTRLRILKLIAEEGELLSQDIMTRLDLSQSAASRHLKQLSAVGYLTARRHDGAKCFTLNPQHIEDTLRAVSSFLLEGK